MLLLVTYVLIAVGFSFLCSIAEAVILSVSTSHIVLLEKEAKPYGKLLRELKENINSPLAVILSLNTIAHTVGAAGAGAQAAAVFGSIYVGLFSAVLTLIILVFSEIIPKALGAHYWRQLAPVTAYALRFLIKALYPFVLLSEKLTRGLTLEATLKGFSRNEFAAMAALGEQEGQLAKHESSVLKNLFLLSETPVKSVMTPRSVVFSLSEEASVADFFENHKSKRFSRIPLHTDHEKVTGFVLRADLLLAQARGNEDKHLKHYRRELHALIDEASLMRTFDELLAQRTQIMLVVDEYGSMQGIVTMEDILESLLGLEIVDEGDTIVDMQELARRIGKRRRRQLGLDVDD